MVRKVVNEMFRSFFAQRYRRLEYIMQHPEELQREWFHRLIKAGRNTEWGRVHGLEAIQQPEDYRKSHPVQDYEGFLPWIKRMMDGESDVLWPGLISWFSKSSGTTSERSKFIPVSDVNLKKCHTRGNWDASTFLYHDFPDATIFEGKSLMMGGSLKQVNRQPDIFAGDVSAIMIKNMPVVARPFFTPDFETALLEDFEEKLDKMTTLLMAEPESLYIVGGVPTWILVLFRRMLELTGKSNILEVFPNLQGYMHGGVSFTPYREQFQTLLPSPHFLYKEVYNASEGYFAIQLGRETNDMVLLVDNGVYYEFLPMSEWEKEAPQALPLWEVECGKVYAMIITTNAGLWRYQIGDTVEFTSTSPYRIRITGRTRQFINAFGEEVMVANTDQALAETCQELGARLSEYTVAPVYLSGIGKGGHEWVIEFEEPPADLEAFADLLDHRLQMLNSDYQAKRYQNLALERLRLHLAPPGTFHQWLKAKGKLGGQHKVPRLSNHRKVLEEVLKLLPAKG